MQKEIHILDTYAEPGGRYILRLIKSDSGKFYVTKLDLENGDLSHSTPTSLKEAAQLFNHSCRVLFEQAA